MLSDGTACSSIAKQHPEHRASFSPDEATFHLYFLHFTPPPGKFAPPNQISLHAVPYISTPLYTTSSPMEGCREMRHPSTFPPGKIIHFRLFSIFLLTNCLPIYIIYEHTFYFFLGQLPDSRPEKRRLPPQNRYAPGKKFKGCRETRLPLPQGGISNCR